MTTLSKTERDKLTRMAQAFDKIDQLLLRIGLQGLQRMTQSSLTELQALQQTAHNAAFINMERLLETLATQVQRYLNRDPLFNMAQYRTVLNRIWLLNQISRKRHANGETPTQMLDILGMARRTYIEQDTPLRLQPLGASGWVTDTDFVGISIYFYVDNSSAIYQVSNCKPCLYFGHNPRNLLREAISDHINISFSHLMHGAFEFQHPKLSHDGRLSLHKDLKIKKAPYMGARAYKALAITHWIQLAERLRQAELQPLTTQTTLVLIEPQHYHPLIIDDKHAHATMQLTDQHRASITLEVPLRAENNFLVDNLQRFSKSQKQPNALFGNAWVADGQIKFFPYTALYNESFTTRHKQHHTNAIHLSLESL